jgi:uncharacterized membrane protein
MTKLGLIAAASLCVALALSAPVAAQDTHQNGQRAKPAARSTGVFGEPSLPVDQAIRFGYSQGYANYPSGWGGIYGDGRYPGNTISNPNSYNTLH